MTIEVTGKNLLVLFDSKLLAKVDDFRFKHRFTTRSEAIRWLIKAALAAKLVPKAEEI